MGSRVRFRCARSTAASRRSSSRISCCLRCSPFFRQSRSGCRACSRARTQGSIELFAVRTGPHLGRDGSVTRGTAKQLSGLRTVVAGDERPISDLLQVKSQHGSVAGSLRLPSPSSFREGAAGVRAPSPNSAKYFDRYAEDVAGAALGADVLRPRRVGLDLAAQSQDLDVDRAVVDLGGVEARELEQLLARQHALWRGAETLQQVELAIGELDALAARRDEPAAAQVELPAGEALGAALIAARRQELGRHLVATQDGTDAGEQLARSERLGEVIVGTELERHDAIGFRLAAADDDDRRLAVLAQLPRELQAFLAFQAQVEHHEVD